LKTSVSSSRINKPIILAIVTLAALFLLQCKGETYLGLDRGLIERRLAAGDYSFLDKVEARFLPGAEIFSFAPGAGYFFGLAARERDRQDLAVRLLTLEIEHGSAPYRHWATRELLDLYNRTDRFEKTAPLAETWLAQFPSSPFRDRVQYLTIEAFYWQKDDREVLARLEKYFPGNDQALKAKDAELFLFKTVASCRLGLPGWDKLVRDFFYTLKASPLHTRLYSYLKQETDKLSAFAPFDRDLFKTVSLAGDGKFREAAVRFERLLPQLAPAVLSGTALPADFAAASLGGAPSRNHATLLFAFSEKALGAEKAALAEAAGKIFLAVKDYGRARSSLEAAAAANDALGPAADPELTKRAVYRLIRIGLSLGAEAGLAAAQTWGTRIVDIDYFSDEADELTNLLMRERKYARLITLASSAPAWYGAEKAELAYIAARLLRENLVPAGADKEAVIGGFLQTARALNPRGYYGFMAAHFLKEEPGTEAFFKAAPSAAPGRPDGMVDAELMADGYFTFGFYRHAFGLLTTNKAEIRSPTLSFWAATLSRRERPFEAIQTLALLRERGNDALSRADAGIFYPRAFAALIPPAAAEYGLNEELLFSLIRQESAFNPGIASHAGAIGLTQLMPDTAAGIAAQLHVTKPDLTEPSTSVRFGAYYLSTLGKRLSTIPYQLAGYNAGPNAARRWKERYGELPADLAVETFDYSETRDFVKSIFSAHVIYNLMYKKSGIKESAALFFGL
jgi:hypothetical protein